MLDLEPKTVTFKNFSHAMLVLGLAIGSCCHKAESSRWAIPFSLFVLSLPPSVSCLLSPFCIFLSFPSPPSNIKSPIYAHYLASYFHRSAPSHQTHPTVISLTLLRPQIPSCKTTTWSSRSSIQALHQSSSLVSYPNVSGVCAESLQSYSDVAWEILRNCCSISLGGDHYHLQ